MTTKTVNIETSQTGMEKTISDGENTVMLKVRYSRTWQEWSVRYHFNGKLVDDKCYFASDKDDAVLTMCAMAMGEQANMTPSDKPEHVTIDKMTLQVLWDRFQDMQQALVDIGRGLEQTDNISFSRRHWSDKCKLNATNPDTYDIIRRELERVDIECYRPFVQPLL